ncbi:MAG: 4-(cytidine 5'-diphospho)-2-C-methyl-D-erythritol kinase [Bacteroidales bacterium]|nr:4-(cytidine 5'-diphospho)-2-C-methyl-D-erythritol kinase [Bacteroidales bacterium]
MICFPNAKINLGLRITEKRADGFHNLETIFYPVHGFCDCLEFIESSKLTFENTGIQIDTPPEKNLCVKAWNIFKAKFDIPPVHMILHKNIPFGGGLGGGSADASFLLTALNSYFSVGASTQELEKMALELGSDCPFFIKNQPVFAEGRGEIFSSTDISLKGYWILLVKPDVAISTAEAYRGVHPFKREKKITEEISTDLHQWKNHIDNDFEASIFINHPEIAAVKAQMYELGAVYASMSGSGATVYGIFDHELTVPEHIKPIWFGQLQ